MKKLLVHIGLHKTGTTFLQELIFKKICKDYNYRSNLNDQIISKEINKKITSFKLNFDCLKSLERINIENGIISNEALSGPKSNPGYYQFFRDLNYQLFGENAHILIVIRKPSDFLSSIYLHNIHKGKIISPENFFLDSEKYNQINYNKKAIQNNMSWLLEGFSYENLIDLYKQKFKNVTVCRFENIFDLNFLNEILELDESYILNLKKNSSKKIMNRGFSDTAVKLSFFLEKNLNKIGMSLKKRHDKNNKETTNKLIRLLKYNLTYKKIVSNIFDKIIPYKKYNINFSNLNFFDINKADREYKDLIL